jgi:hypothetical protein
MSEAVSIVTTFCLTVLAWIVFRAESLSHALKYCAGICSLSLFSVPRFDKIDNAIVIAWLVLAFLIMEWLGREQQYAIARVGLAWPRPVRWMFYSILVFTMGMFMQTTETPFIYFQF